MYLTEWPQRDVNNIWNTRLLPSEQRMLGSRVWSEPCSHAHSAQCYPQSCPCSKAMSKFIRKQNHFEIELFVFSSIFPVILQLGIYDITF